METWLRSLRATRFRLGAHLPMEGGLLGSGTIRRVLGTVSLWLLFMTRATAEMGRPLPPRFHVPPDVASVVVRLLDSSPTFRRQVDRIVEAQVRVVIDVSAPWELPAGAHAVSTIVRVDGTITFVRIRLVLSGHLPRLLAHELEHVLEQLDGVDLAKLAEAGGGRAWETGQGSFETARAVTAGERVRAELRRGHAPTAIVARRSDPK